MRKILKFNEAGPISIHLTDNRNILLEDTAYLDLEFSPFVTDMHPTFDKSYASLVVVTYSTCIDKMQVIEKVTWNGDEAAEVVLAIKENRWKVGQAQPWQDPAGKLISVDIYSVPVYRD